MKLSCLQENLARGLSIVGRAVASRTTLPVLSNVLLATDQSQLKLSATNLEISITCWIGAKVEDEGAITVPARLMTEFVSSLPVERIDMELAPRTQTLNLKCSRVTANIKGIDPEEFPIIPTISEDQKVEIDGALLRDMIRQVSLAAATDESRPVMTGVMTKVEGDLMTMAAADGFRLSIRKGRLLKAAPEPLAVIIPARSLNEFSRISTDVEGTVEITVTPNRNQILFHLPNMELVSQLIEGTYPAYEQIIPKSYQTRTVASTAELLKTARQSAIFARDAANLLRLQIAAGGELSPGRIKALATAAEVGDNVGEVDASVTGQDIEVAFNVRYWLDVLGVIDAAEVALETTTPTSPAVIKMVSSDDFLHIIMPMHIAR